MPLKKQDNSVDIINTASIDDFDLTLRKAQNKYFLESCCGELVNLNNCCKDIVAFRIPKCIKLFNTIYEVRGKKEKIE